MSSPVLGRVKWFNNKSGYGFITTTVDGAEKDVFVHHSAISVSSSQYKYLVQGEYVQFNLDRLAEGSSHEVQATNVRGVQGGPLQCESRRQRIERRPVREAPSATSGTVAALH
jgi:cold shock CspA family protein